MGVSQQKRYNWNTQRKMWHISGCVVVIVLFYQWKDIRWPVNGSTSMVVLGWMAATGAVAIDVIRFVSPKNNAALVSHPVFGVMLRQQEQHNFNASTYLVLASAILVTLWHFGVCHDVALLASVATLGLADPAAAGVRYWLERKDVMGTKFFGLLAFTLVGIAVMWTLCRWYGFSVNLPRIVFASAIVGLLEAHTGLGVRLTSPLTRQIHSSLPSSIADWLRRVYPDDNLLVPLATAALMEFLRIPQI